MNRNEYQAPNKAEIEAYIPQLEARLKATSSRWMKSEVRKTIAFAKAELARMA